MASVPPSVFLREKMLGAGGAAYPQMREHLTAIAREERRLHKFSFDTVAGVMGLRRHIAFLRHSLNDPSYPYPHVAAMELKHANLKLYVECQHKPKVAEINHALIAREREERKMPESARRALNWIKHGL